jgi:hypothetical protein
LKIVDRLNNGIPTRKSSGISKSLDTATARCGQMSQLLRRHESALPCVGFPAHASSAGSNHKPRFSMLRRSGSRSPIYYDGCSSSGGALCSCGQETLPPAYKEYHLHAMEVCEMCQFRLICLDHARLCVLLFYYCSIQCPEVQRIGFSDLLLMSWMLNRTFSIQKDREWNRRLVSY